MLKIYDFNPTSLIDYPSEVSSVVFLPGCNYRCGYCHNYKICISPESNITEEDIFKAITKNYKTVKHIVISGGEPTLQANDLYEFMKKVKDMGMSIKLDTNGTNLEFLRRVFADGLVDYVAMDIKAMFKNYCKLIKNPEDYCTEDFVETLKQSIDLIRNSKIKHEFRMTYAIGLSEDEDAVWFNSFACQDEYEKCYITVANEVKGYYKYDKKLRAEVEEFLKTMNNLEFR